MDLNLFDKKELSKIKEFCHTQTTHCFIKDQKDRFNVLVGVEPENGFKRDTTLYWTETFSDAVLLCSLLRKEGFESCILGADDGKDGYCVWSSEKTKLGIPPV